jgi:hypothetical protein
MPGGPRGSSGGRAARGRRPRAGGELSWALSRAEQRPRAGTRRGPAACPPDRTGSSLLRPDYFGRPRGWTGAGMVGRLRAVLYQRIPTVVESSTLPRYYPRVYHADASPLPVVLRPR